MKIKIVEEITKENEVKYHIKRKYFNLIWLYTTRCDLKESFEIPFIFTPFVTFVLTIFYILIFTIFNLKFDTLNTFLCYSTPLTYLTVMFIITYEHRYNYYSKTNALDVIKEFTKYKNSKKTVNEIFEIDI